MASLNQDQMQKSALVLIAFFCLAISATAQFTIEPTIRNIQRIDGFAANSGHLALFLKGIGDEAVMQMHDSLGNKLYELEVPRLDFLGKQLGENLIITYVLQNSYGAQRSNNGYYAVVLPTTSTARPMIKFLSNVDKSEELVAGFVKENVFYLITVSGKTNQLFLRRYFTPENVSTSTFNVDNATLKMLKRNRPVFIDGSQKEFEDFVGKLKLYFTNDRLTFVNDPNTDGECQLRIIELDLNKATINNRIFPLTSFRTTCSHSSYFIDEKIFVLENRSDLLSLTVFDYTSGSEIKKFSYTHEDSIALKKTDVMMSGKSIESEWRNKSTGKVLKELRSGTTTLGITHVGDTLALMIGSYYVDTGGTAMGTGAGGTMVMRSYGGRGMIAPYFISFLDANLNIVNGRIPETFKIEEKVLQIINEIEGVIIRSDRFESDKAFFYAYRLKGKNEIIVRKLLDK